MIVTVSERKSPPYSPTSECNAVNSFSSTESSLQQEEEEAKYHTSAAVDDAMMWPKRKFEDLRDRPRNNPLHFHIERHVPAVEDDDPGVWR